MSPTIRGVGNTRESRQFRLGGGLNRFYDPMFQEQAIGTFYQMQGWTNDVDAKDPVRNKLYQTSHCDIKVYRASTDDFAVIPYKDAFRNNGLYNPDGTIHWVGKAYFDQAGGAGFDYLNKSTTEAGVLTGQIKGAIDRHRNGGSAAPRTTAAAFYTDAQLDVVASLIHKQWPSIKNKWYAVLDAVGAYDAKAEAGRLAGSAVGGLYTEADLRAQLAQCEFKTSALFNFLLEHNVPIYLPHYIFVPNIRWMAGTCIMVAKGAGNTYVGNASYRIGLNSKTGNYVGAFNINARSAVERDERVVTRRNVFVTDYVAGDNGVFYHPDHQQNYKNNKLRDERSMFSVALTPKSGFTAEKHMDISGFYNPRLVNERDGKPHYPTSALYKAFWEWDPSDGLTTLQTVDLSSKLVRRKHPTFVYQGLQMRYNTHSKNWTDVIREKGPFGENLTAGMQSRKRQTCDPMPVPFFVGHSGYNMLG